MKFKSLDIEKANSVLLYITSELEKLEKSDFTTVFKVLYFADRKHLASYGRPILKDNYIAMKNGPVPSAIYDCFKLLRDGGYRIVDFEIMYKSFKCDEESFIYCNATPNMDIISGSEIECIQEAIAENKHLSFKQLSDKSHDLAWNNASKNDMMSIYDIARAGGANDEMIKYIAEKQEEEEFFI